MPGSAIPARLPTLTSLRFVCVAGGLTRPRPGAAVAEVFLVQTWVPHLSWFIGYCLVDLGLCILTRLIQAEPRP